MKFFAAFGFAVLLLCGVSCSSAPKRPPEIFTLRNIAANQLEIAHQTANRGRYEDALLIIQDVRKTVVGVDDPPLIIRTEIVYGNVLFSMGRRDEAFAAWETARIIAEREGEQKLASLSRVYTARGRVVILSLSGEGLDEVEEIRAQMNREIPILKGDPLGEASAWVTSALAEKELKLFQDAEYSMRQAIAIHEKDSYLEDAAYDWFLIASIFSVSGRYDDAVEALHTSIRFDRKAENGFGIASSWQAIGDVYTRKGDTAEAEAAYRRASEIYRALGIVDFTQKIWVEIEVED